MGKKKILIISGDQALLELLEKNLSAHGYHVISSENNEKEANKLFDMIKPNLIILDIMMPKMEGIKLCVRIRQQHDIPVLLLTANTAKKDKVKGLDLSSEEYLTDPIDADELTSWVKEIFLRSDGLSSRKNGSSSRKDGSLSDIDGFQLFDN